MSAQDLSFAELLGATAPLGEDGPTRAFFLRSRVGALYAEELDELRAMIAPAPSRSIDEQRITDELAAVDATHDGQVRTAEQACCEPAGGAYCRVDAIQASLTPVLWANRNAACNLGTGTGMWPSLAGAGFPTAPSPAAVRCSPVSTLGAPFTARCQNDGNPCTTMSCNAATGACTAGIDPNTAPAESFVDPATGMAAMGMDCESLAEGTFQCSNEACNGSATCQTSPRADGTTSECGPGTPSDAGHCLGAMCVGGSCNPAGDPTPPTGSLGACPPASAFPAPCVGPPTCSASTPASPEWPDLPDGCRPPAGFCYLSVADGSNGVLDGICRPSGAIPGAPCSICDPAVNPFSSTPRPSGAPCDDNNICTPTTTCNGAGQCVGACDPTRCLCNPG